MTLFVPSIERDLRLDLFRGLANWAIFFGHIPGTALAWLTSRNYGFSAPEGQPMAFRVDRLAGLVQAVA